VKQQRKNKNREIAEEEDPAVETAATQTKPADAG
jgi:hypothetical protein